MSDIVITLDSAGAIKSADSLTKALDRIENKAKEVKRAMSKFLLSGKITITAKRLATDMKAIQAQITARPLYAKVRLSADKRTLKGLKSQVAGDVKGWKDPMFSGGTVRHPGKGVQIDDKTIGLLKMEDALAKSTAKTRAAMHKNSEFYQLRRLSKARAIQKVDIEGAKKAVTSRVDKKAAGSLKEENALAKSTAKTRELSHREAEFSQLRRLSKARAIQKVDIEGAKKRVATNVANTKHLDYFKKSQAAGVAQEMKRRQVVKTIYNTERAIAVLRAKSAAKMFQNLQFRKTAVKDTAPKLSQYERADAAYKRLFESREKLLGKHDRRGEIHKVLPEGVKKELDTIDRKLRSTGKLMDKLRGEGPSYAPPEKHVKQMTQAYEKEFKRAEKLQRGISDRRKIAERGISTVDMSKEYKKVGDSVSRLNTGLSHGTISQKKFNKELGVAEKRIRKLDTRTKRLNKTVRAGRGFFMNFTMALTAIAASMFIWQKVRQVMEKVLTIGNELSQTFAKMRAETGMVNSETSGLVSEFSRLSDGTEWGVPKIYEAYKILRKEGLGANEAIKQIIPTMKIAKNEGMKLADAAKMAAHDTYGLREQYLKLDKEIQKTALGAWNKLKKSMRDVFEATYMKQEPKLIKALNELNDFMTDNQESIIAGLNAMASTVRVVAEAFLWLGGAITIFIGKFNKIEKIGVAKLKEDLDTAIKAWHNYYKKLEEVRAREDTFLGIDITGQKQKDIDNITAAMNRLRKVISDLQKQIDKTPKIEKSLLPTTEQWEAGYKQIYSKLGVMAKNHYKKRTIESEAFAQTQVTMFEEHGTKEETRLARLAKNMDAYNLRWEDLSKYMKDNAEMFKLTGAMSDNYYNNLIKKIKEATQFQEGLNTAQKKEWELLKVRAVFNMQQAAKRKPHEEVFESTGAMTNLLRKERIRMAKQSATDKERIMPKTEASRIAIAQSLAVDLLKIDTDRFAKSLENEAAYFDATGRIRQDYVTLQKGEYARAALTMIEQGMSPEMAEEGYREMVKSLCDKLLQPMQDAWQKYYSATGIMSEKHIALEERNLYRQYEYMKIALQDQEAAYAWLVEAANKSAIKRLESEETVISGMQAAWYRLEADSKTMSEMVSEAWVQGARNIENAFKDTFFDTMKGEWDNYRDHAINILEAIRDTVIESAYAILKASVKPTLDKLFGGLLKIDKKKEAEKILLQTAAMEAQTVALGVQTGVVYGLVAAYQALAVSMAACGFGGGGSGIFSLIASSGIDANAGLGADWAATLWHKGGKVGDAAPTRMVPSSLFTHAPRLHKGLNRDEFPAILERGEEVIEKGTKREEGNVYNININAVDAKSFSELADQNATILLSSVSRALKNNPSTRHAMKRMIS